MKIVYELDQSDIINIIAEYFKINKNLIEIKYHAKNGGICVMDYNAIRATITKNTDENNNELFLPDT